MPFLPTVWSRLAREVHALMLDAAGLGRTGIGPTAAQERRLQPLCSGVPWDARMARDVLRIVAPRPRSADGVSYEPPARRTLLLVSALRISHAVLTGRRDPFRDPAEWAIARRACERAMGHMSPASGAFATVRAFATASPPPGAGGARAEAGDDPGMADLVPVPFRYLWARPVSGGVAMTESTAVQHVVVVDAGEAPVGCRLGFADGRAVDLRLHGETCLRPVMSPSSGTPMGVRAFREAARLAPAWPDDPWNGQDWAARDGREDPPALPCMPVAELGTPALPGLRDQAEAAREARLGAVRARVGTLFVVGGVVHRACPVPQVFLARAGGEARCTTAWGIRGHATALDGPGSLRVGAGAHSFQDASHVSGWRRGAWPSPWHRFHPDDVASLPASLSVSSASWLSRDAWPDMFTPVPGIDLPRDPGAVHEALAGFLSTLPSDDATCSVVGGALARHCLHAADRLRRRIPVDPVRLPPLGRLPPAGGHADTLLHVLVGLAAEEHARQPDLVEMADFVP